MGIYSTIVKGFIDANTVETVQIIEIKSTSYMWFWLAEGNKNKHHISWICIPHVFQQSYVQKH